MRKFLLILIILLVGSLLALWSPWRSINISISDIFKVEEPENIAALQVYSLSGSLDVYIDEKYEGTATLENSPFIIYKVTPGDRLVKLVRKSDVEDAYWTFSKLITFEEGTDVVVSYNLGPEEQFSEGHVIYAVKASEPLEKVTKLHLKTNLTGADVYFDNIKTEMVGNELVQNIALERQYSVRIEKEGFENLEFKLLPDDKDLREKLKDYEIYVEVELMYQPIQVE